MLVSSAPIVIPVNTANLPTESVAADAAQRPRIPQPPSPAESSSSKNSTEFSEQKSAIESNFQTDQEKTIQQKEQSEQQNADQEENQASDNSRRDNSIAEELEADDLQLVRQLQSRDREVRAHEQAHASVGGSLAGSPNLNYTNGPDGKRYAISGDVAIDASPVANNPEATIQKLEQVQRAALAPANPSSQDLKVAAKAASSVIQARSELNVERLSENQEVQQQGETSESTIERSESSSQTSQETSSTQGESFARSIQSDNSLNPVTARRQSAQLNQKIEGSGALDLLDQGNQHSFTA